MDSEISTLYANMIVFLNIFENYIKNPQNKEGCLLHIKNFREKLIEASSAYNDSDENPNLFTNSPPPPHFTPSFEPFEPIGPIGPTQLPQERWEGLLQKINSQRCVFAPEIQAPIPSIPMFNPSVFPGVSTYFPFQEEQYIKELVDKVMFGVNEPVNAIKDGDIEYNII